MEQDEGDRASGEVSPVDGGDPSASASRRRIVFNIAQVAFLIAAVVFAGVSLRSQWPDIARDVARINPAEWILSLITLYVGLLAFGLMWRRVLAGFGYRVPLTKALGIFYVGQLGRYIPGSVWSFGAQAAMARSVKVPPRVTVIAGLVALGFSLATAGAVGLTAVAAGLLPIDIPWWLAGGLALVMVAVLFTPLINLIGTRLAGSAGSLALRLREVLVIVALLAITWTADGLALMVLSGGVERGSSDWGRQLSIMIGAYGLSYVVGVVVIFAPAGLGAREAALVFLLTPTLGVPAAAALAIVSRVPITITDFTLALVFWLLRNHRRTNAKPG